MELFSGGLLRRRAPLCGAWLLQYVLRSRRRRRGRRRRSTGHDDGGFRCWVHQAATSSSDKHDREQRASSKKSESRRRERCIGRGPAAGARPALLPLFDDERETPPASYVNSSLVASMASTATTVVVPCYNEEERLKSDEFVSYFRDAKDTRVLFVDDGSTDRTADVLMRVRAALPSKVRDILGPEITNKLCAGASSAQSLTVL